jgi:hypothetical protein
LIDTGRLKTVIDFEKNTGFRQQRISGMRKFLEDSNAKSYFAGTDHIFVMNKQYGISLRYLILGEMPILEPDIKESDLVAEPRAEYTPRWLQEIREELNLVKDKYDFLKERMEFHLEKSKA